MEFLEKVKKSQIFENISEKDIRALNFCFKTRVLKINKGETILNEGDPLESIILVLSGHLRSVMNDYFGNTSIIADHYTGFAIGVEEAFSGLTNFQASLIAIEDSELLLMNKYRVIKPCENMCPRHITLQNNLVKLISQKNINLLEKFHHITKHTTRDKVLSYLQSIKKKVGSSYFDIPFNRQELADYLSVERSALSNELSKMQNDGLIEFNKNHFHLK